MKLLIDAQLPPQLCEIFGNSGIECRHVNSLPVGDETPDNQIAAFADQNGLIVVTKDADFYHSHMIRNQPRQLLLITAGNIKNRQLFDLIRANAVTLINLLTTHSYVELSNEGVIAHSWE